MEVEPKLKPLYANLKRLKIGEYLYTNEFNLFTLENNLDEIWKECKREVSKNKRVVMPSYHNTEDEEQAFMFFICAWYNKDYSSFHEFLLLVLLNFAKWHQTKLDYTGIIQNIKQIGISKENVLNFTKDFRKIQEAKPVKVEETKLKIDKVPDLSVTNKKIFIVHGRDDKSRLELCNLLKDDLKLEPVVLQDKPNNSIETIISKFERLASECSAAIVLFTPDDDTGESKRARQNVIFELGYFLGKLPANSDRRIIILKKGEIEIPSDISGVVYIEYNNAIKEIFYDLKKQLDHWGYKL